MKTRLSGGRIALGALLFGCGLVAGCGGVPEEGIGVESFALNAGALNRPVKIGNVASQMCWGPETYIGAAQHINQYTCGVAGTYIISTSPNGANYFRIKPASDSTLCADIEQGTTWGGERLQYYFCHGGGNQDFYFDSTNGSIRPRYSNQCLDVPYGRQQSGLLIQQYPCNYNSNQRWMVRDANPPQTQYFP